MSTAPVMSDWVITYNDYVSGTGAAVPAQTTVRAAYYAPEDPLVEFKDDSHQVVFALHADIVLTILRADAAQQNEVSA